MAQEMWLTLCDGKNGDRTTNGEAITHSPQQERMVIWPKEMPMMMVIQRYPVVTYANIGGEGEQSMKMHRILASTKQRIDEGIFTGCEHWRQSRLEVRREDDMLCFRQAKSEVLPG